jgi:hypothetical protein
MVRDVPTLNCDTQKIQRNAMASHNSVFQHSRQSGTNQILKEEFVPAHWQRASEWPRAGWLRASSLDTVKQVTTIYVPWFRTKCEILAIPYILCKKDVKTQRAQEDFGELGEREGSFWGLVPMGYYQGLLRSTICIIRSVVHSSPTPFE